MYSCPNSIPLLVTGRRPPGQKHALLARSVQYPGSKIQRGANNPAAKTIRNHYAFMPRRV